MKKIITLLITLSLLLSLSSCTSGGDVILDNSDSSKFVDFYTDGDYAYIECELNIYSESDGKVRISAVDEDDVKTGLLKNSTLTGTDSSGNEVFNLKRGENRVTVLFRGDYAGVYELSMREIPRFIKIEKV